MLIVHVDRGWAWATTVGAFISNIIIGGLAKSFGIVMKEFEEIFECPSAYMTLAGGLIYTFMYATSIGVHYASTKFGTRLVMAIGAIGSCACIVGAAVAPSVEVWVALIGGGLGFFLSCIYFSCFVVVGRCFDKHLGVATGISIAGISVGQMIFPNFVSYLIEEYTIRGGTLVAGGMALHFLISAILMPSEIIREPSTTAEHDESEEKGESKATPMDWSLFLIFTLAKIFSDVGDVGLSILYPPFGTQIGLTNDYIGYAIAVAGGIDLLSRLSIGWISDRKYIRRSFMLVLAWIISTVNAVGMASVTSYPGFVACYGIFGVCSGTAMALMVVVLTDFVGPDHLPKAFAIMMVAMGLMIAPGQFFLGHIKDMTNSYRWSIRVAAVLLLVGTVFLILESPIRWYRKRRMRTEFAVTSPQDVELSPIAEQTNVTNVGDTEGGKELTSTTSLHIITNASVPDSIMQ